MSAIPSAVPEGRTVQGTAFAHLEFVLTGIVMTLLGPLLPSLSARWLLNDTQAGYLFTTQFAASIGGMVIASFLISRRGYRVAMIAGVILMAAGVALLAGAGWILGFASICIYGVGFGVASAAVNLFVAFANPAQPAAALNLVNSSWGAGAMGCPLLVATALRWGRLSFLLYALALALAALAFALSRVHFVTERGTEAVKPGAATPRAPEVWWLAIVGVMFFTYVGTENSVGGWVAAYARRIDPAARVLGTMVPSFFWGALLLGRVLAPLVLRRVRDTRVAAAGLALASLGIIGLLTAKSVPWVAGGAAVVGAGLASVYPIKVSLLPRWFGSYADRLGGLIFSMGSLGGAALPWVVGAVSTQSGSLRTGFVVPLFGTLLMLTFYSANFLPRREPA